MQYLTHTCTCLYMFSSLLSLFWKMKVRLCDLPLSVCLRIPSIRFWMAEPVFMKSGMYIMVPGPISTSYFINPFNHSLCLYMYSPIVDRQRLGKNVTATKSTHAKIELLDASFSMRSVSCYGKQAITSYQNSSVWRRGRIPPPWPCES
jgi:hypothetical protein